MERKKMIGLILLIAGLVFISINLFVIYPFISCFFAPLTFWLLAVIAIVTGIILFFNISLTFSEEEED